MEISFSQGHLAPYSAATGFGEAAGRRSQLRERLADVPVLFPRFVPCRICSRKVNLWWIFSCSTLMETQTDRIDTECSVLTVWEVRTWSFIHKSTTGR